VHNISTGLGSSLFSARKLAAVAIGRHGRRIAVAIPKLKYEEPRLELAKPRDLRIHTVSTCATDDAVGVTFITADHCIVVATTVNYDCLELMSWETPNGSAKHSQTISKYSRKFVLRDRMLYRLSRTLNSAVLVFVGQPNG